MKDISKSNYNHVKKNCIVLIEQNGDHFHAGSKARNDVDTIFNKFGFKKLFNYSLDNNIDGTASKSIIYYISRMINCLKTYCSFHGVEDKILFVQFPSYSPSVLRGAMRKLYEKNNTVFLVHDVDLLRNFGKAEDEIEILNSASVVIVHNEFMASKLQQYGLLNAHIVNLELFDYLVEKSVKEKNFEKAVVFAGNLKKSQFLSEWVKTKKKYALNLYGNGLNEDWVLSDTVNYCGAYPPEVLPHKISGGFGLIWDGVGTKTCDGDYGEYLKYNNPHKLSLYIAAGIPVIVWNKAAVAALVKKYNIGYCIETLDEINNIMDKIDFDRYELLKTNIKILQKKVLNGEFLSNAVNRTLEWIVNT
ncbi:hypothetical protein [Pectinatus haikarae]|uniref:hypothetical protein n=1 Tax=Pectinatus haikarae TaxID=349096 RepID=UPI0018C838D9|nr:hypothetical protein [Pectinatus haikarae]